MAVSCIWYDTTYTASTSGFTFSVKSGSTELHSGIAEAYPDGIVRINIAKICEPFVPTLPFPEYSSADTRYFSGGTAEFNLYRVSGETDTLIGSWKFLSNYDYENQTISEDCYLSNPINGKADPRMLILVSQFRNQSA